MQSWFEAFVDVAPGMLGYVFLAACLWLAMKAYDRRVSGTGQSDVAQVCWKKNPTERMS